MLTVKYIRFDGSEEIDTVARVIFYPTLAGTIGPSPYIGGSVALVSPGSGEDRTIRDGTIYVMNDTGKTVGKYDLGSGYSTGCQQGTVA